MVDNNNNNNINLGNFSNAQRSSQGFNNFSGDQDHGGAVKEQDRLLPIANVGRIMKQILPPNAKISKEAKETMQECVSEFISFVTGEASDKCHKEKRKTVNGDDICWALGTLGFDDYAEPLKGYLNRYRELEGERSAQKAGGGGTNNEERSETSSDYGPVIGGGGGGGELFKVRNDSPDFDQLDERSKGSFSRRF